MPVAHVATTNGSGPTLGSGSVTFSYTSGSGSDRLLLVQVSLFGVTSVTYAGASLTNVGAGVGSMSMWRKTAPAAGANNVVISGPLYNYLMYTVSDWTGVDQTTPLGSQVGATGSSSSPSTGSITCPANGFVAGGVRSGYSTAPGTITAGSGTTLTSFIRETANGTTKADGRRSNTGALSWTLSTSRSWEAQGFPINPSVSFTAKLPEIHLQAVQGSVI